MQMQIGKVYHQEFQNGERLYVRIIERFANGRFKGLETYGRCKPVQRSVDPTIPFWIETAENDIPKKLR